MNATMTIYENADLLKVYKRLAFLWRFRQSVERYAMWLGE